MIIKLNINNFCRKVSSILILMGMLQVLHVNIIFSQSELGCGFPNDNFWDFEDILSCPDEDCDADGAFPEIFPECLCGTSPGVACNYNTSHGTPHLHEDGENHFGAMISRTLADPLAGEGLFFCVSQAKADRCINLNFDLLVKRKFHYETAVLNIKLVNPDEMITQLGEDPTSCTLEAPDIDPNFVQNITTLEIADFAAFNNTNNFFTHNVDINFTLEPHVISEVTGSYNLWFYFENSDERGEIVGIDNIQLTTGGLVCYDYIAVFEPDAPIQGNYYAAVAMTIFANTTQLAISNTTTFQASESITMAPLNVFTDISGDEYVLLEIFPIECVECVTDAIPYQEITNSILLDENYFPNKVLRNNSINEGEILESQLTLDSDYIVSVYNLFGQLVHNQIIQDIDKSNFRQFIPTLAPGAYIIVTRLKSNGQQINIENIIVQ